MAQVAQPTLRAGFDEKLDDTLAPGAPDGRSPISDTTRLLSWFRTHYDLLNDDYSSSDPIVLDAKAFIRTLDKPTNPGPGSAFMKGPMHFDSRNHIRCNTDLENLANGVVAAQTPENHPAKALLEKVLSYWTSANSLKQLERFADIRQPYLDRLPLPDGMNLHHRGCTPAQYSEVILMEYSFRRLWIRHLHFPGLLAANLGRQKSFDQLYKCARVVCFSWIPHLISFHRHYVHVGTTKCLHIHETSLSASSALNLPFLGLL